MEHQMIQLQQNVDRLTAENENIRNAMLHLCEQQKMMMRMLNHRK